MGEELLEPSVKKIRCMYRISLYKYFLLKNIFKAHEFCSEPVVLESVVDLSRVAIQLAIMNEIGFCEWQKTMVGGSSEGCFKMDSLRLD